MAAEISRLSPEIFPRRHRPTHAYKRPARPPWSDIGVKLGHMKHEDELCFSLAACFRMLTANQAQTTAVELTRPHLAFLLGAVEVSPKRPSTAYPALLQSRSPPAPARRSPALPCSTGAKHLHLAHSTLLHKGRRIPDLASCATTWGAREGGRRCLGTEGGRVPPPGECGNGEWAIVSRESDGVWALGFGVTAFIRPRHVFGLVERPA